MRNFERSFGGSFYRKFRRDFRGGKVEGVLE